MDLKFSFTHSSACLCFVDFSLSTSLSIAPVRRLRSSSPDKSLFELESNFTIHHLTFWIYISVILINNCLILKFSYLMIFHFHNVIFYLWYIMTYILFAYACNSHTWHRFVVHVVFVIRQVQKCNVGLVVLTLVHINVVLAQFLQI